MSFTTRLCTARDSLLAQFGHAALECRTFIDFVREHVWRLLLVVLVVLLAFSALSAMVYKRGVDRAAELDGCDPGRVDTAAEASILAKISVVDWAVGIVLLLTLAVWTFGAFLASKVIPPLVELVLRPFFLTSRVVRRRAARFNRFFADQIREPWVTTPIAVAGAIALLGWADTRDPLGAIDVAGRVLLLGVVYVVLLYLVLIARVWLRRPPKARRYLEEYLFSQAAVRRNFVDGVGVLLFLLVVFRVFIPLLFAHSYVISEQAGVLISEWLAKDVARLARGEDYYGPLERWLPLTVEKAARNFDRVAPLLMEDVRLAALRRALSFVLGAVVLAMFLTTSLRAVANLNRDGGHWFVLRRAGANALRSVVVIVSARLVLQRGFLVETAQLASVGMWLLVVVSFFLAYDSALTGVRNEPGSASARGGETEGPACD